MELFFLRHLLHNGRKVTLVVSKTDSLMTAEYVDLMEKRLTHKEFDEKLLFYQQQFKQNMRNQVALYLREGYMPDLDVIFISHPKTDNIYHGYDHLIEHLENSLETSAIENLFLIIF